VNLDVRRIGLSEWGPDLLCNEPSRFGKSNFLMGGEKKEAVFLYLLVINYVK